MGAHGQLQGLGAHWEIWMMQQGGMTAHEALKTATIFSAQSLGFDDWIGSLEAGKRPQIQARIDRDNIRNTESIHYTMVNGRLYEAETLNEVGNYNKPRPKFYWEARKNWDVFSWQSDTETHEQGIHCHCGKH